MKDIGKIDAPGAWQPGAFDDHVDTLLWTRTGEGLLDRLCAEFLRRGAHPGRSVVLLPYAQLLPWVTRWWVMRYPDSFAPRFETTMNWTASVSNFRAGPIDISFDVARDALTARALLRKAGFSTHQDALADLLVQAAHQLAPLAAARSREERGNWAQTARSQSAVGMEAPALALEAGVYQIAVEWAALSSYATDAIFQPTLRDTLDCLVFVQGFTVDPLGAALLPVWGEKLSVLKLLLPCGSHDRPSGASVLQSTISCHACRDSEDEAQRSAACVLQHVAAGRFPVALVSTDRALTRRVRAMLEESALRIRDENGWKLSTVRAGAGVMGLLRAAAWNASTDTVLNWMKSAPIFAAPVAALEMALRREPVRDWRDVGNVAGQRSIGPGVDTVVQVNALWETLRSRRTLAQWLDALRHALEACGMWDPLLADAAGGAVVGALLLSPAVVPERDDLLAQALWAQQRLDLTEFTAWVNQALEEASYKPAYPDSEQVVILPLSQLLGRPFAAVVLAGCDEVRLNACPEPPGNWTTAQRVALGLPSRETVQGILLAAWNHALQAPAVDVLWRTGDDGGEPLMPSALVQIAQLDIEIPAPNNDPRVVRSITPMPLRAPSPNGALLPPPFLSASAYEDLRQCPYRFFALRQLGLRSVDELDVEVGKRDFGVWLHAVLKQFHEIPAAAIGLQLRREALDDAAQATTVSMHLAEGEFLPFAAAWPKVREGYLEWLSEHEAAGAAFALAETSHSQSLGAVTLVGRIDRTDRLPDGTPLVLDYKTEPVDKTRLRTKEPLEDTQIVFYAALLPNDTLQGAYVNVGEREGTRSYPQPDLVVARDALVEGILHDMERIARGDPLPALGEGMACDYCQARGLCRKDFWAVV